MPHKFGLTLKDQQEGDPHFLWCEFADDEWERLHTFASYAQSLESSNIFTSGVLHVRLVLKVDNVSKTLRHESHLPPEDATAALLHRMRPFVLNNEPTYFHAICKIMKRRMDEPQLRRLIEFQQEMFSGNSAQQQLTIKVNDLVINSERTLMNWLNAFEYHRDQDKQRELDCLNAWFPDDFSKGLFIDMVLGKANAVINIGRFLRWIDRGGEEPFSWSLV